MAVKFILHHGSHNFCIICWLAVNFTAGLAIFAAYSRLNHDFCGGTGIANVCHWRPAKCI